ncbi:hypothetical protein ABZZ16_22575, partial [Streptomyces sp. NPDC006386]
RGLGTGRPADGARPGDGCLATAYVLILVVLGPLTARYTEPVATWWSRRREPGRPERAPRAAEAEAPVAE